MSARSPDGFFSQRMKRWVALVSAVLMRFPAARMMSAATEASTAALERTVCFFSSSSSHNPSLWLRYCSKSSNRLWARHSKIAWLCLASRELA